MGLGDVFSPEAIFAEGRLFHSAGKCPGRSLRALCLQHEAICSLHLLVAQQPPWRSDAKAGPGKWDGGVLRMRWILLVGVGYLGGLH